MLLGRENVTGIKADSMISLSNPTAVGTAQRKLKTGKLVKPLPVSRVQPKGLVQRLILKGMLKELDGCQSADEIQPISAKIKELMSDQFGSTKSRFRGFPGKFYVQTISLLIVVLVFGVNGHRSESVGTMNSVETMLPDDEYKNLHKGCPEKVICEFVKTILDTHSNDQDFEKDVMAQFETLRLFSKSGKLGQLKWETGIDEACQEELSSKLNIAACKRMVEQIAVNCSKNNILHEILVELQKAYGKNEGSGCCCKTEIKIWIDTMINEAPKVLPINLAWAMALERINRLMLKNTGFANACDNLWNTMKVKIEQAAKCCNIDNMFFQGKYNAVRNPVEQMIKAIEGDHIDSDFLSGLLPHNIRIAIMVDKLTCQKKNKCCEKLILDRDNSYAGNVLAKYGPRDDLNGGAGIGKYDMIPEHGISHEKIPRKLVELKLHDPKKWANLYMTWNLAFCFKLRGCIKIMMKLLIPSVSGFHGRPETYIHTRADALYATLMLGRLKNPGPNDPVKFTFTEAGETEYFWNGNEAMIRIFGAINKKYAEEYEESAQEKYADLSCCRKDKIRCRKDCVKTCKWNTCWWCFTNGCCCCGNC